MRDLQARVLLLGACLVALTRGQFDKYCSSNMELGEEAECQCGAAKSASATDGTTGECSGWFGSDTNIRCAPAAPHGIHGSLPGSVLHRWSGWPETGYKCGERRRWCYTGLKLGPNKRCVCGAAKAPWI